MLKIRIALALGFASLLAGAPFAYAAGEMGEAANVVKKLNRVRDGLQGNKETPEQLKTMLGKEKNVSPDDLDLFHVVDTADEAVLRHQGAIP